MVQHVCAMTGSVQSSRQNNNDLSLSSNKWTSCHVERVWMPTASHLLNFIAGLLQNDLKGFVERETKRFAGDGKRLWLSNQRTQKLLDWRKEEWCLASKHDFVDVFSLYFMWELETNSRHIKCSRTHDCVQQIRIRTQVRIYISFHSINWKWKLRRKGSKKTLQVVQHPSEQS